MVEEIKLKQEKKNKYDPEYMGEHIIIHMTVLKILVIIFILIGFIMGALLI